MYDDEIAVDIGITAPGASPREMRAGRPAGALYDTKCTSKEKWGGAPPPPLLHGLFQKPSPPFRPDCYFPLSDLPSSGEECKPVVL